MVVALCAGDAGCEQDVARTLNVRFALSREVRDEAGNLVTPGDVQVRVGDQPARACALMPDRYACPEGRTGDAQVEVTVGDQTWTKPIRIRDEADGCHNAYQELDFVLDGLAEP